MRSLDLGGTWLLASRPAAGAPLPCAVPGTAIAALVRAGAAPDPRAGGGAAAQDRATRVLSRAFDADATLLREARVSLEIPFLPAGASVLLNGRPALPAAPSAGPRHADVRRLLKRGSNEIAAVFPPERAAPAASPEPGAPPRVPAAGLPGGARLLAWSGARVADLGFGQRHDASGPVELLAGGWIETDGPPPAALSLSIRLLDPDGAPAAAAEASFPAGGAGSFHAVLRVSKPRFWWPAGLGPQPLYSVRATLRDARGGVLDVAEARVGLRTLAPVARPGGAAALACNGRPFFLRGAVWRCPNPVAPPVSRGDFEPLLASAADGRFNALRLAADEPPPPPPFWDLCDELGLVVLGAAPAAEAALAAAERAGADAPAAAAPPFLRHACVPDVLLGEPDEESGLAVVRTPVSLPSPEALAAELPRAERNPTGPAIERRTALRGGAAALVASLAAEWPLPQRAEDWTWLSQLAAARAMRRRVAAARTAPGATGLLWDPFASAWAAADAASVDRDGRWKALQYEAARVFAPEALFAPAPDADPREPARYVNATAARRRGTLAWRLTAMDGTTLAQGSRALSVSAFSHAEIPLPDPAPYFARWDAGSLVLWLSVLDGEGFVVSRDHRLYAPPRRLRLQDPGLAADVAPPQTVDGEQVWRVTVSVSAPAFGIFLEMPGRPALFGDGFFALEPDETLDVDVTPLSPLRETVFRRSLRVRSLWDLAYA
ncbi:MAG: hypothetical protein IJV65_02585 [Kiritimatiellae bacterium]|nr:hypothetical protein [Kiritimatiellia bacterium]